MLVHKKMTAQNKKTIVQKQSVDDLFKLAQNQANDTKSAVKKPDTDAPAPAPQAEIKVPKPLSTETPTASMSPKEKTFGETVLSYVPESVRDILPEFLGGNPVKSTPDIERKVVKRDEKHSQERNDRLLNAVGFTANVLTGGALTACATKKPETSKPKTATPTPPLTPTPDVDPNFKLGQGTPIGISPDYGPLKNNKDLINTLLSGVSQYQPAHKNIFDWPKDRPALKDTKVSLIVTMAKDIPAEVRASLPNDEAGDAFTVALGKGKDQQIAVFLIADRIFYDANSNEKPDATVRALTAMSHELYGNVQTYLEAAESKSFDKPIDRKDMEIRAFKAGIDFLERFAASDKFKTMTPKIQSDVKATIEREKKGLLSWQTATIY